MDNLESKIDELLKKLDSIANKTDEGDALTDEEIAEYETVEKELATAQRSLEIQKRNEARRGLHISAHVSGISRSADNDRNEINRSFEHFLRTGKVNSDMERAQSAGTDSAGGYLVPTEFRDKVVERMLSFGGIQNAAEILTTSDGRPMEWTSNDDTANSGELVAENAALSSQADLVLGQVNLNVYRFGAGGNGTNEGLEISKDLLSDSAVNIQDFAARKLAERIARAEAPYLVSGTGSNQPKGVIHGLTGVESAANTGLTYDDLVGYEHSVDPAYRANAVWAFNDTTWKYMKTLKDANGDPLWRNQTENMGAASGGLSLLGYPVVIDQAFANINTASGTVDFGVFGDLREGFVVRRVSNMEIIVDPYSRAAFNQVVMFAFERIGSVQNNANAYKALTCKT